MRIACFAMSMPDHFNGVIVAVEELVLAGATVRVWTDKAFRARIEAVGAQFADMFANGTADDADDRSVPRSARGVAFAVEHCATLAAEARAFGPALVLHDTFALVGRLVAERLDRPRVVVTAGHAVNAAAFRAALPHDPMTDIGPRCWAAVERLRDEFGIADASPFSYIGDPSPWLNLCKEPAEWVDAGERAFLGPIAFFSALPRDAMRRPTSLPAGRLRVYAAFGTIIWRYWRVEAIQALEAVAAVIAQIPGATLTVGLGGAHLDAATLGPLRRLGAVVHDSADQWAELANADVFITHHGLGSTHEAVACGVPMLSLPFFWDQPALARRTQDLGLALPLIDGVMPGNTLSPAAVRDGLDRLAAERTAILDRLRTAREWEARTIAHRPQIARQILALAR